MKQRTVKFLPGIHLDELVYEKVLNWKRIELNPPRRGMNWMWDRQEGNLEQFSQRVPPISKELDLAWRLLADFRYADIRKSDFDCGDKNIWSCYLKTPTVNGKTGCEAHGLTPAHAICLAALRSVGVIIEEEVQNEPNGQVG
jgi:hypothetical protein